MGQVVVVGDGGYDGVEWVRRNGERQGLFIFYFVTNLAI